MRLLIERYTQCTFHSKFDRTGLYACFFSVVADLHMVSGNLALKHWLERPTLRVSATKEDTHTSTFIFERTHLFRNHSRIICPDPSSLCLCSTIIRIVLRNKEKSTTKKTKTGIFFFFSSSCGSGARRSLSISGLHPRVHIFRLFLWRCVLFSLSFSFYLYHHFLNLFSRATLAHCGIRCRPG